MFKSEFNCYAYVDAFGFNVAAAGSGRFEFVVIVGQVQFNVGYQAAAETDFIAVELVAHAGSAPQSAEERQFYASLNADLSGAAAAAVAVQFNVAVDIACINVEYRQDFVHQVKLLGFNFIAAAVFVLVRFWFKDG